MRLPGQLQLPQHVTSRAGRLQALGIEGLELDCIGAGGRGSIHEAVSERYVALVVDAGLGNYEGHRFTMSISAVASMPAIRSDAPGPP